FAASAASATSAKPPRSVRIRYLDTGPGTVVQAGPMLPGKVSYMLGNDPRAWHIGLPTYSNVTYSGLYPHVNLAYEGQAGRLKGTYTIAPGGDPTGIRWRYEGHEGSGAYHVAIDGEGNLIIKVPS